MRIKLKYIPQYREKERELKKAKNGKHVSYSDSCGGERQNVEKSEDYESIPSINIYS